MLHRLLLDPAPPEGGGISIPEIPAQTRTVLPALAALGEEHVGSVKDAIEKNKSNLPPVTAGFKKSEEKPAATPPVAPEEKPAATPPAQAQPQTPKPDGAKKITVGGKEYTEEELRQLVDGKHASQQPSAPTEQPPVVPQPEQKPLTPEEIAQKEGEFVENRIKEFKSSAKVDEKQLETILSGGPEGAKALTEVLHTVGAEAYAKAQLDVRRAIYADIEQIDAGVREAFKQVQPLLAEHQRIQQYSVEQSFLNKHPDFKGHVETARKVATKLIESYPQQCYAMTPEQFIDEVAAQTDSILTSDFRRWNQDPNSSWRNFNKAAAPPVETPAPAPAPVATPPAPPALKPPGANPPASVPANTANWHKSVAASLQG
jgi:hypothetical protein